MYNNGGKGVLKNSHTVRKYAAKFFLLSSPLLYVVLWNLVINNHLTSLMNFPLQFISSAPTREWAKVQVSARPEVVVWRMGILPVYWSEIGNLLPFHKIFFLAYCFYFISPILKARRVRDLNVKNRLNSLDLDFIKRFWLAFGAIAFLTTSLSTVAVLADLLTLIYYVMYLVSLPMAPISLYMWRRKGRKKEEDVKKR